MSVPSAGPLSLTLTVAHMGDDPALKAFARP